MLYVPLVEAAESIANMSAVVTALKKSLNSCSLVKYKSKQLCDDFYRMFFENNFDSKFPLTFSDWMTIYNQLLSDSAFTDKLCYYMAIYIPTSSNLFKPLKILIKNEYKETKNKIRYISTVKANLNFMRTSFDSIFYTIKSQVVGQDYIPFNAKTSQVLYDMIIDCDKMIKDELVDVSAKSNILYDDVSSSVSSVNESQLVEFHNYLKTITNDSFVNDINEGVIGDVKDKIGDVANDIKIKFKKAEEAFDNVVNTKIKKIRDERKLKKHSEIVGESLPIMGEIKRILKFAPVYLFAPAIAVVGYITTIVIDKRTDQRDREQLTGDIKNTLEIVDEKISIADRKGDDKAKIELMRDKQKLIREVERISKLPYNKN